MAGFMQLAWRTQGMQEKDSDDILVPVDGKRFKTAVITCVPVVGAGEVVVAVVVNSTSGTLSCQHTARHTGMLLHGDAPVPVRAAAWSAGGGTQVVDCTPHLRAACGKHQAGCSPQLQGQNVKQPHSRKVA
jgi:hypothetical protein